MEGEEGDREGFSLEVYRYIKLNRELRIIADVANESLYSIRTQCNVYSMDNRRLVNLHTPREKGAELPFTSMTSERD